MSAPQNANVKSEEDALKPESQEQKKMTQLQFIIFQETVVVQVYSEPLFIDALLHVSDNLNGILFPIVNVVFGFVGVCLINHISRRPLMIYPSMAKSFTCLALGTQIQFRWGPNWLTVVLVYTYCITTTCGAATVPYVMVSELFLSEVPEIMSMLAIEWAKICIFLILYMFNPFIAAVGIRPVFYVFALISFITSLFCFFYLPETEDLTVDVIQTLLLKGKQ